MGWERGTGDGGEGQCLPYYDSLGDFEVVEESQDVFGDDGDGGFVSVGLRAAGIVVVENDTAVGGEVGEDGEIVVLG